MSGTNPSTADAVSALRTAEQARKAAQTRPPAPAWFAPARGLLFGAVAALLLGPWADDTRFLTAGLVTVVAFLGVHGAVVSRGGVITMTRSAGTFRRRFTRRLMTDMIPFAAYGLGWLAAIPFGHATGAIVSAVLGGAMLWAVTAREESRLRA
jgi:hypothetical protein